MKKDLHYFYSYWTGLNEKMFRSAVREFIDNGADKFVITCPLIGEMLKNRERVDFLHKICKEMQVEFSAIHAPYGKEYDLNIPESRECREKMFDTHIRALRIAAEFGCRTYPIHMGAYHYCFDKVPLEKLRPLARETMDKILPEAEKLGIIIAVENSFEKPNSAKETLKLIDQYAGNPFVGVCYDTGHANLMEYRPGKEKSNFSEGFRNCWWEGIEWENDAIGMLKDHIVTCHIHDNNGYSDLHAMPKDGTIDWQKLMPELFSCPRMIEYQTEVCFDDGTNWAGKLMAPAGGYSIRRMTDTFRSLGF